MQEAKFSPNWMLIMGFGRYVWPRSQDSSLPSLLHPDGIALLKCLMDDVLIFGRNQKDHDERLFAALTKIQTAGVTLNPSKCEFNKCQLKYLGHLIDQKCGTKSVLMNFRDR